MHQNNAKIISLVPSWTETLIECDVNVVGRTRFCIHPSEKVKSIQALGGTKKIKIEDLLDLKPDFVILDKEENTLEMSEVLSANNIQMLVSHVSSVRSAAEFLKNISSVLQNEKLAKLAAEYEAVLGQKIILEKFFINSIIRQNIELDLKNLDYVIWKNPYMVIGVDTFIADVFSLVGIKFNLGPKLEKKYPEVNVEDLKKSNLLFSSEPFPFEKEFENLSAEGFGGAVIDGEKISWYGVRNLRFLQSCFV